MRDEPYLTFCDYYIKFQYIGIGLVQCNCIIAQCGLNGFKHI